MINYEWDSIVLELVVLQKEMLNLAELQGQYLQTHAGQERYNQILQALLSQEQKALEWLKNKAPSLATFVGRYIEIQKEVNKEGVIMSKIQKEGGLWHDRSVQTADVRRVYKGTEQLVDRRSGFDRRIPIANGPPVEVFAVKILDQVC